MFKKGNPSEYIIEFSKTFCIEPSWKNPSWNLSARVGRLVRPESSAASDRRPERSDNCSSQSCLAFVPANRNPRKELFHHLVYRHPKCFLQIAEGTHHSICAR